MRDLGGFHEQALLAKVAKALDASRGMGKEESRPVEPGITVRTLSFEKLVQELARDYRLFVMDRKGTPIRDQPFPGAPCFVLTDHLPMPKNSLSGLKRLGAGMISLGSRMLFASQCVVLIHHELDARDA
jgi:tRNA (pseudouridine54-N1)-methyltransferase